MLIAAGAEHVQVGPRITVAEQSVFEPVWLAEDELVAELPESTD